MQQDRARRSSREEEGTDFSFDPGSQVELDVEDACCVTGEPVKSGFCRFPDYRSGTMMVLSHKEMLKHLRVGTTIETFKKVLVKRHGKSVLKDYDEK